MNLNALQGRFTPFDDFQAELSQPGFGPRFVFIEPKYGAHGFDVTGPGDFTCGNSMHPLDDVTSGEKLIKTVYEAIRNSPQWENSLLLVTFDEHGGFYDHVRPPTAVPPGDTMTASYIQHHFQYDQLGVRVPALVISPLIPRGVIDHTIYDHTSMLASVERLFKMKPLTKRDSAANDFLHLLSLGTPRSDTPMTLNEPATNPHPLSCEKTTSRPKTSSSPCGPSSASPREAAAITISPSTHSGRRPARSALPRSRCCASCRRLATRSDSNGLISTRPSPPASTPPCS